MKAERDKKAEEKKRGQQQKDEMEAGMLVSEAGEVEDSRDAWCLYVLGDD